MHSVIFIEDTPKTRAKKARGEALAMLRQTTGELPLEFVDGGDGDSHALYASLPEQLSSESAVFLLLWDGVSCWTAETIWGLDFELPSEDAEVRGLNPRRAQTFRRGLELALLDNPEELNRIRGKSA
jgi:hypothetical protein